MPCLHGANKSILFALILDPYEVTLTKFAQIKRVLFAHVYKALVRRTLKIERKREYGTTTYT